MLFAQLVAVASTGGRQQDSRGERRARLAAIAFGATQTGSFGWAQSRFARRRPRPRSRSTTSIGHAPTSDEPTNSALYSHWQNVPATQTPFGLDTERAEAHSLRAHCRHDETQTPANPGVLRRSLRRTRVVQRA